MYLIFFFRKTRFVSGKACSASIKHKVRRKRRTLKGLQQCEIPINSRFKVI